MATKDAMLAEYDREMATTRKLLDRLPDTELGWKPHEKSMSLGRLATHLASIPRWAAAILNETSFDLAGAPGPLDAQDSRGAILEGFDASTRQARSAMDKADTEWTAMWTLKRGGQELFSAPRVTAFRTLILSHLIHHRGQLSVYLRLLNIPVPAIYGPSADEK